MQTPMGPGRTLIPLAAAALLSTACPGDDSTPADGTTSTDTTGTTTTGTTTTGPSDSTSTSTSGSTGAESTSTGADGTSTGTDSGSESSESSTGDQPGSGYGDCIGDPMACAPGEVCLSFGPLGAVCAEQGCRSPDDCDMPPGGDAVPACDDIDNDFAIDCHLDCSGGAMCPEGMLCVDLPGPSGGLCIWEAQAPGGGECPDQDVGNMVPQMLMGDNTGLFDDVIQTCGGGGGEDALYLFTAPADGTYRFDTVGTGFDTTLSLLDMCGGMQLECNDDFGGALTSQVELDMVTDQSVVIVVDSFNGATGAFNLNITQP